MINSKTKFLSLLLMLLLAFTACTQPDMQEEIKALQPQTENEAAPVVARINLPGAGTQTRTILPGEIVLAHHYTITLSNSTLTEPIVLSNLQATEKQQVEIRNVPVGKYTVHVDGHNEAGQIMLKGDGNKTLDITLDQIAEVQVEVFPQYGPELKGSIEVTFDWTALVNNETTNPSDSQTVETVGPLMQAIKDGHLEFELYTGKIGGELTKTGDTVIWNTTDTTTIKCLFQDVPTGKNIYAALTVKDQYGNVIVDKQYGITAQVFANQTSYYNGDPNYKIHLGTNQDIWYSNISNVSVTYPRDNADSTFIVNWDDIRKGNSSIFSEIRFSYGKYNVPEAQKDEKTVKTFIPTESREDNHFEITGLAPNTQYYIKSQAISKGGKLSDTRIWTLTPEKGFMTKVNLGGITFDVDFPLPASMLIGDKFEVKASIKNEFATYPNLEYKVVDLATSPEFVSSHDAIFFIDNPEKNNQPAKVTANRPGVAKIEATNNDINDPNYSKQTETFVKVTLAKPINVTADIVQDEVTSKRGIHLTWTPVSQAEEYIVYRSDDKASNPTEFVQLGEPVKRPEFTDTALVTGHTYQYKIVATAPSIDAAYDKDLYKFSATSAESDVTAPTLIPVPAIEIVPTVIEENKFELYEIINEGEKNNIYKDPNSAEGNVDIFISLNAGESKTVGLKTPISGFDTYTWLADNTVIISGTFENANSIVLSDKLEQLDPGNLGSHTITFIASTSADPDNGPTFSANIGLTLVKFPVQDVQLSVMYKDTDATGRRYSTAENAGDLRIKGKALAANGETPTVQLVMYRLAPGADSSVATIDQYNGTITIFKDGVVTFQAYSSENNTILDSVELSFYRPTVKSTENLVTEVNNVLSSLLTKANGKNYINGDWWYMTSASYVTDTVGIWRNATASIYTQSATGGIELYGYDVSLGSISKYSETSSDNETVKLYTKSIKNADKETDGKLTVWANGGNYHPDNALKFIGYTADKKVKNIIYLDLPYNQGKAYIQYSNVNLLDNGTDLGEYKVWFEHEILLDSGKTLNWTAENPDTVKVTTANRPRITK